MCGFELPAPYEDHDDESDGYDTGDFANPYPTAASPVAQEHMVDFGVYPPGTALGLAQRLHSAGIRLFLYPPLETSPDEVHLLVPEPDAGAAWQVLSSVNLKPEQMTILSGAEVYLTEEVFSPGTVVIAEGAIVEVLNFAMPDPHNGASFIDLTGMSLAAGFIDIHSHGMLGIDTNQAGVADFQRWSAEAAKFGTTALLPTTLACPVEEMRQVLENFRQACAEPLPGARLLGVHAESNFISPEFKGAQPLEQIFPPDDSRAQAILDLLDTHRDLVRIVTVAPEVSGAPALISWLTARGIIVSLGHSAASYDDAIAGLEAGATQVTHLFNAMSPLHHRNPGLVGAALERDELFVEMVCDGQHIHPAVISATISAKGAERFIPVTDSLQGVGLPNGSEFTLGGQHVRVVDGVSRLDSGTIAGSVATMDAIVRILVERLGWNLGEALFMAATTPADSLGRHDLGRIAQGALADLVVLDADLQVAMTIVNGKIVYTR